MSLSLRLTLTYSAISTLLLAVLGGVLYAATLYGYEAELEQSLREQANVITASVARDPTHPERWTLPGALGSSLGILAPRDLYYQVLDLEGRVLARSENLSEGALPHDPATVARALDGQSSVADSALPGGRAVRVLTRPLIAQRQVVGLVQVAYPVGTPQALAVLRALVLPGIALLGVAALLGWVVAHRRLRTLRAISEQAAVITQQRDFGRRLAVRENLDEVGRLARTIDQLLATVEETLHRHREFVADTSHELRNPLLAIRTNLDLLDRVVDPESRAECLREAREQVERMSRLVADLLVLARGEVGQVIERQPVELDTLVAGLLAEVRQRAPDRQLLLERADPVEVLGDAGRLTQVLANLIDNALRHTPPDGTIAVRLEREHGWARLTVADTGEGIPPEHLPHVFDRFYRVRRPGMPTDQGTGLGLAIVKHLAEAHGGRVTAESEIGRGSRFTVWLPLGSDQPAPTFPHPGLISRSSNAHVRWLGWLTGKGLRDHREGDSHEPGGEHPSSGDGADVAAAGAHGGSASGHSQPKAGREAVSADRDDRGG